jgi:hypothetical protein
MTTAQNLRALGLNLGPWNRLVGSGPFAYRGPAFAGISGGRTSAMMAALCDERVVFTFCNTGREHPRTLDYLNELDAALGRRIVWLEFRPPRVKGARPRDFEFAVVDYRTAARKGEPFDAFMQALAEYRAANGEPPLAPWARGRICTGYLKHKVKEHYIASLGITEYDNVVGLRADEPRRVRELLALGTKRYTFRCPLFDAQITKKDVLAFWASQSFDLDLPEHLGNCTGCYLKDYADISRALGEPETDAAWWIAMQRRYKDFGGRNFPGYDRLLHELPTRLSIEAALRRGEQPESDGRLEPKHFKLVVIQERKRMESGAAAFSCACEATHEIADDEEDSA